MFIADLRAKKFRSTVRVQDVLQKKNPQDAVGCFDWMKA